MNTKAIAITTIQSPTKSLVKFTKMREFTTFVAGDNKTPQDWQYTNANYLSMKAQKQKYPQLFKATMQNHYARKNFAYLEAIQNGAQYIFETDDDNFPNSIFPNFIEKPKQIIEVNGALFANSFALFTKQLVWPRGLALNYINKSPKKGKTKTITPLIQHTLADLDPDVDAIYRLTNGNTIRFDKQKIFTFKKSVYTPFNSQATYWNQQVFPLLYLPSTVNSRVTDIWRGYIAQRILWELNSQLIILSPCVYQIRNAHNLMQDFANETELYLKTEAFVKTLEEIKLTGNVSKMLGDTYKTLVKKAFFKQEELEILKLWLSYFK